MFKNSLNNLFQMVKPSQMITIDLFASSLLFPLILHKYNNWFNIILSHKFPMRIWEREKWSIFQKSNIFFIYLLPRNSLQLIVHIWMNFCASIDQLLCIIHDHSLNCIGWRIKIEARWMCTCDWLRINISMKIPATAFIFPLTHI